jgi:hypothetical protein
MSLGPHSTSVDSDSESSSDTERPQGLASQRRLTDFLELEGLSDADMGDNEADNLQETLYREEKDKFSHARAKLDASWKPKQKKKKRRKIDTEVDAKGTLSVCP